MLCRELREKTRGKTFISNLERVQLNINQETSKAISVISKVPHLKSQRHHISGA